MKEKINSLNTYFWNVGNDIADIRLLAEGALVLFEGDAEPLHRLGMMHNEEVAASAFDTIGTALYDLCEKIAAMQHSHLNETINQSAIPTNNDNYDRQSHSVGLFRCLRP